jgi:selenide,water dikinase
LCGLSLPANPRLITGISSGEDAGVFLLDDDRGLVLTVDFFSPMVDDPWKFGAIAAANALSDVYAVGGAPLAALNICAFPPREDRALLRAILQGGADKAAEAGAVIAGGHTVRDEDLKYGMAVIGMVRPDRMVETKGAKPGDWLVLTKPIGVGLFSTARKKGAIGDAEFEPAVASMLELNRWASEAMVEAGAGGATDITGFGLLGHALEMAKASGAALSIDLKAVPVLPGAFQCARAGHVPSITAHNLDHFGPLVDGVPPDPVWWPLLFDPQTSGGLLISLSPGRAEDLAGALRASGRTGAIIGEVLAGPVGRIMLR